MLSDVIQTMRQVKKKIDSFQRNKEKFSQKLAINHKKFGLEVFKQRNDEYFDVDTRFQTPYLKLREKHKS